MVAAVKIKIIDEDAQTEAQKEKKELSAPKAPKKRVAKKTTKVSVKTPKKNVTAEKSERKTPLKKKAVKKKALVVEKEIKKDSVIEVSKNKEEVLDLKKEKIDAKEEIKKDIFANIDSVKKIVEEEGSGEKIDKNDKQNISPDIQNKKDRDTVIGNLNNKDESSDLEAVKDRSSDSKSTENGAENDDEGDEYLEENHNNKSLNLYKKIAYFFIFLVLILVSVVLYFSFVRVKIVLIPNQEKISNNMIFDIYDKDKGDAQGSMISGVIREEAIESLDVFEAGGTEVIGKEAVGEITIINNYTQNQPLVASTRMIPVNDPDKLFRLKETVNIPAGGEIKAEIYADEPSPEMAIKATRFTIPGLWAGLQDKIYAESKSDIVYRQKVKKYILESDFDDAKRGLRQTLLSEAKAEINEAYKEYGEIIYKIDENSIVSDFSDEAGDELDEFEASIKADVVIVAFDEKKAALMAQQKFTSSLSSNKELISFDEDNIIYALNNYDVDKGEATVNASFEGRVSLKENSNIVEVDNILGLKKDQLDVYLGDLSDIAGYEIKFYPSFLPDFLKKVPRLVDKIEVEIKK